MLIFSMSVSIDGFVADRQGGIDWTGPDEELFDVHHEEVGALGGYLLGRRLYETMSVWETDPSLRDTAGGAAFADVWAALAKVVFSRTLHTVEGNARLASGTVAEEAAALAQGGRDVSVGGADLAAQAFAAGLVDEIRMYRVPIVVGGGTPFRAPVADPLSLTLAGTRTFASGVVFERYRRRSRTENVLDEA